MKLTNDQLAAYLARIGYQGPVTPTLSTLQGLHLHHPRHIPFENLDSWLGITVSLDPDSVFNKLVVLNRGGYCFEQNQLFHRVLATIGFQVEGLAARVLWNLSADIHPPRTHQALLVTIDGLRYLVDVGFGGLTPLAPMALIPHTKQASPLEIFCLSTHEHGYQLNVLLGTELKAMYSFTLEPASAADYQQGNWYVSTYPESRFVCHLITACVRNSTRYSLFNRQLSIYRHNGEAENREITDPASLKTLLTDTFGIPLAQLPDIDKHLQSLFTQ